jgi:regulator of sigma E protease
VTSLLAGIVLIGVIVLVHEWGHFVAARLFGIGVPVFSIGMGKRVWGFRWGETEYRVSQLPLGGYVQLAGADAFGESDDEESARFPPSQHFLKRPIYQRLVVLFAGPAVNLVLPILLTTAILLAGRPVAASVVAMVRPDTAAAAAGLAPGDRVTSVDGVPVGAWRELEERLDAATQAPVTLTVEGPAGVRTLAMDPATLSRGPDGVADLYAFGLEIGRWPAAVGVDDPASPAARAGLRTGDTIEAVDGAPVDDFASLRRGITGSRHRLDGRHDDGEAFTTVVEADPAWVAADGPWRDAFGLVPLQAFVASVSEGFPGSDAGVQVGDRLYALDGVPFQTFPLFVGQVTASDDAGEIRPLALDLIRAGERVRVIVTPVLHRFSEDAAPRPVLGVGGHGSFLGYADTVLRSEPVGEALSIAWDTTWWLAERTLLGLYDVITGATDVQKGMGGPVDMVRVAGDAAEEGWQAFVATIGMVSLSVGLVNLLPVPVLDGGQILFFLLEAVRGRPLPLRWRETIQLASVLFLLGLMVLVTAGDVLEWVAG